MNEEKFSKIFKIDGLKLRLSRISPARNFYTKMKMKKKQTLPILTVYKNPGCTLESKQTRSIGTCTTTNSSKKSILTESATRNGNFYYKYFVSNSSHNIFLSPPKLSFKSINTTKSQKSIFSNLAIKNAVVPKKKKDKASFEKLLSYVQAKFEY